TADKPCCRRPAAGRRRRARRTRRRPGPGPAVGRWSTNRSAARAHQDRRGRDGRRGQREYECRWSCRYREYAATSGQEFRISCAIVGLGVRIMRILDSGERGMVKDLRTPGPAPRPLPTGLDDVDLRLLELLAA